MDLQYTPVRAIPAKNLPSKRWSRLYTACQQNAGSSCKFPAGESAVEPGWELRVAKPLFKIAFLKRFLAAGGLYLIPILHRARDTPKFSKVRSHSLEVESREAHSNGFRTSTELSFIPSNPKLLRP